MYCRGSSCPGLGNKGKGLPGGAPGGVRSQCSRDAMELSGRHWENRDMVQLLLWAGTAAAPGRGAAQVTLIGRGAGRKQAPSSFPGPAVTGSHTPTGTAQQPAGGRVQNSGLGAKKQILNNQ